MRLVLALSVATTLAACGVPNLGPKPELAKPSDFVSSTSLDDRVAGNGAWPRRDWWRGYGDPQLDTLMTEALRGSPDIAVAAARLRSALGAAQRAGARGLPTLDAEGSAGLNKQSYNNGIPAEFVPKGWNDTGRIALEGSFDLDLFGRNRANFAAATSDAEAARFEADRTALALTTSVAATYADLARLYSEQDVLLRALAVRTATERLVGDRVASGLDTQGELRQARSSVPAARVELAANAEQIDLTRNALAALVGAGPDRGRSIERPKVILTAAALPSDAGISLVARRPDIVAARARAEAAGSRIRVARAAFYPNISLSGLIGLQSLGLDKLFKSGSSIGDVGPALSLPLFDGGERSGQYRQARAGYDEAVATYNRTLIDALREVADAVTSRRQLASQVIDARTALNDAEGAYQVAQLRYRGGLSSFLNVLSSEQNVLSARRSLADVEARSFTLDVQLVRALGGGFQDPNTPSGETR
ncbi:efflux transporter outer membrane subunit [Sphingomonas yunnanensis]|uniref:efflux transporter outer membrane subunit n=1 Tax=Sphingomonas yunnanensis TaxID=310400 RepID=UPI001CA61C9D|nr:efflux transporter outer membrane subunit [Sphingomonas yunnanensis]MBY9063389.1 efflux transporter outer membrane subunit [Sphingomonas yunnanensis]